MKVLESRHIYLSSYEDKYFNDFFSWENNLDELNKWSLHKKVYSRIKFKSKVEDLSDENVYNNLFFIINKKNEELIGYVGYECMDYENGNFAGFTYIKPDYRGMAINAEAWLIFLNYMFQYHPVKKVISSICDCNKSSLNNVQSAGFKIEGIRKKHVFLQGEYHDLYLIAMFREDFYIIFNKYKNYIYPTQSS